MRTVAIALWALAALGLVLLFSLSAGVITGTVLFIAVALVGAVVAAILSLGSARTRDKG